MQHRKVIEQTAWKPVLKRHDVCVAEDASLAGAMQAAEFEGLELQTLASKLPVRQFCTSDSIGSIELRKNASGIVSDKGF